MDTKISTCLTNKWRVRINQDGLYNKKVGAPSKGLGKMAKNQSLPTHLQKKDSKGEENKHNHVGTPPKTHRLVTKA